MFNPGDKIRIKNNCIFYPWYSENTFTVIDVDFKHTWVILDRDVYSPKYNNTICFDYIILEYIYDRKEKLQQLNTISKL